MKFQRHILRDVQGYVPGEQPRESDIIKLNTNENPYPPSPRIFEALQALNGDAFRKYPDPVSLRFRRALAERYGYPDESWVIVGNGMDELLALVLRTFVDPGDTVLATDPTYSLYEILCKLHDCRLEYVALDEHYQLSPAFFSAQGRLCFLTRPNAPSGVAVPKAEVARFCTGFDGIVVIDEAYVDFAEDNCLEFARDHDNVIVMRTFSKSFSLAGMRIGTAVARPELIAEFLKTKDSYNMNVVSQAIGLAAINDYDHMLENVAKVKASRTRLRDALLELGFKVPESQSNFLLAEWRGTPDAQTIFEALKRDKILVRYFKMPRLEHSLRITVGTDAECAAFVQALKRILHKE